MVPDPGRRIAWQNQLRTNQRVSSDNAAQYDRRRRRDRGRPAFGLASVLKLLLLVAVVVLLARNPGLRAELWTLAQNLGAYVQGLWADTRSG
ncbi:hypothetical protein AB0D78_26655 [Streptomyces avermitilis]|uniref:hypothetical protein n=1 Tax=Streptomyces avermitilis TaxID=33903 RepID=UPI0033E27B63